MLQRVFLSLLASILLFSISNASASGSLLQIHPYSSSQIPLQVRSDALVDGATYVVYFRTYEKGNVSPWERVSDTQIQQGYFKGEHGQRYDFRTAVYTPESQEMVVLADFDFTGDGNRLRPVVTAAGFSRSFQLHNAAIQGKGCYQFSFRYNLDTSELEKVPPSAMIGLRFDARIPARDWSMYRYLEMYYYGDVPGSMDLFLETRSVGVRKPLYRFSENGSAFNQWHRIVIDLNELLGQPEARKEVLTCAFVKPIHALKWDKEYTVRLDAIRLWKDDLFVSTTVDETPPTKPVQLSYELKPGKIVWSWKPSQDDGSGIAGYSYLFTNDRRKSLPRKILTQECSVEIPFHKPPFYQEYYFILAACNQAGTWSPIVQKGVTFTP